MTSPTSPADLIFAHLVTRPDGELDLAAAALMIAEVERPDLEVADYLATLDEWGGRVRDTAGAATPEERVEALTTVLFESLKFRGNQDDYYDPKNSFLDQVMDRRTGIPITLSIVFLEVARRAGLVAHGIGFPGHFLVRVDLDHRQIYLDPFHRGVVLDEEDLAERLLQTHPGTKLAPEHLTVVDKRQVLTRLLNNLYAVYGRSGDLDRGRAVASRIKLLAAAEARAAASPAS